MEIGGFQTVSLIDYPGKISCIVFTIGCNFRCPFCYVPQLVIPEKAKKLKRISEETVLAYLDRNRNLLDAVVITGGEPTLQKDLEQFIRKVKSISDFSIAIETNGSNPKILEDLINRGLVNYVSMDIKNVLEFKKYKKTSNLKESDFENVKKSIEIIKRAKKEGKIDGEFRTTIVKGIHTLDDIKELCKMMKDENYYIQKFKKPGPLVGKEKDLKPYELDEIKEILSEFNVKFRE